MRKNTGSQYIGFQAVSVTDGSPVTSGTPVVYYTIDGGTQGTCSNTAVHEGNGQWTLLLLDSETNGNHVVYTFTLTNAISQSVNVYPVGYDETATNLPANIVSAAGTAWGSGAITAAAIATGAIDADALATDAVTEIADGVLARDIGSGTSAGSSDERTVRSALRALRNKWTISSGVFTVYAEDDTTAMWNTNLVSSGTAEPITSSSPTALP